MPLPSDRFFHAGATPDEVAELERRHEEASVDGQVSYEQYLAGVDNVALVGILEDLRAEPGVLAEPEQLHDLGRDELNARAQALGVDAPDKLRNKAEVIDAIQAAEDRQTAEGGSTAGSPPENPADGGTAPAGG